MSKLTKAQKQEMTMRDFIKENKRDIDHFIKLLCPNCRLNDEVRRSWILKDEGLSRWARSSGVRI